MRRTVLMLVVIAVAGLVALPAVAADNGFYLGGSIGQTAVKAENLGDFVLDDDDFGYKVFAGFRFLTFLAVEGSYRDFGTPEDASSDWRYSLDLTGFDLFGVGLVPLGIADIFVKAGLVDWDADLTTNISGLPGSASDSGTDLAYGVGFQLRFRSFAVRLEVEYFDVESTDHVFMFSVGGSLTF